MESLSIYKEEIDAAHELFQRLQNILLTSTGSPWSVRWFFVERPLRHFDSPDHRRPLTNGKSLSSEDLASQQQTIFEFEQAQKREHQQAVIEAEKRVQELEVNEI